ncbi:class II aldolase, partial [Aureobasidium melanogenum]
MSQTQVQTTTATFTVDPVDGETRQKVSESAIAADGLKFTQMPTFDNLLHKRRWQLEHMAGAFRVFARKGYTEGTSGHISVRDQINPDTFWINPLGYHFALLKASDMVHVDELGNVIGGNRAAINVAGFMIHSAIHRARPDVHAACHTHSVYGKAWSTFGKPLDIVNQDACMFWNNHVVYSTFGGMVLEKEEGERIAAALGPRAKAAILQNHGILTVGGTVDEAAAYYTLFERACQIQLLIESTGLEKVIISDKEAEYTQKAGIDPEALYTDFQPDFAYELHKSKGQLLN